MQPIVLGTRETSPPSIYEPSPAPASAVLPSLLPEPAALVAGDVGAELAALAVRSGQLQRAAATSARDADEARAQDEANQEVQDIRAEAQSMRQQAWFDAATTVATATAGGKSRVLGSVLAGARALGDGLYGADQKDDEASAKGREAGINAARFAADAARDAVSDSRDFIRAALDFYREYVAARAQTSAAALRGA